MPLSKARKRLKKSGQRESAGRFHLSSQNDVVRVFGHVVGRAALVLAVCVLASSTLSDPLQKLAEAGILESIRISGAQDFTSPRQQERLALLRRTAGDADAVRHLSRDELLLLFGQPSLRRREPDVESWHFTSAECALDVYFPHHRTSPVYAEYRVRGQADEQGLSEKPGTLDHQQCVKALFAHARFETPRDDLATGPTSFNVRM